MSREREGIAPRDLVFGSGPRLPGQVFAAEILTRPVLLRKSGGELEVTVDRRGVQDAVYNTAGKNRLCREVLHGDRLEMARRLDGDIHLYLLEASDGSWFEIPTSEIPLRWASGGVLPVVSWRGGVWSPFFFRDIPPVGWNIAVGSTEAEAELIRPVSFGLREFVEETIVLPLAPGRGRELAAKTFPYIMRDDGEQFREALDSVNRHLHIRSREDHLKLPPFPEGEVPHERAIETSSSPTRTRLRIRSVDGEVEVSDVQICFNLLELGIEVVSIVRYALAEDDYILDGEMLTPAGGRVELVRMPVAMISHAYLEKMFGRRRGPLRYDHPPLVVYDAALDVWKQVRSSEPSVKPERPPGPGEIVVFDWDVGRRAELSGVGSPGGRGWKSDPMRVRHRKWIKTFGRHFEMDELTGSPREAYPFFTPVSAKAVTYYFAQAEGIRES
jgi:hypothetical protein